MLRSLLHAKKSATKSRGCLKSRLAKLIEFVMSLCTVILSPSSSESMSHWCHCRMTGLDFTEVCAALPCRISVPPRIIFKILPFLLNFRCQRRDSYKCCVELIVFLFKSKKNIPSLKCRKSIVRNRFIKQNFNAPIVTNNI